MDTRILFGYLASPVFRIRILPPACIQYSDTVCGCLTPSPYMLAPWGLSRLSLSPGARARHTDTRGAARLHKSGSRLPAVPDMTPPLSAGMLNRTRWHAPASSHPHHLRGGRCTRAAVPASEVQRHLLAGHLGLCAHPHTLRQAYVRELGNIELAQVEGVEGIPSYRDTCKDNYTMSTLSPFQPYAQTKSTDHITRLYTQYRDF